MSSEKLVHFGKFKDMAGPWNIKIVFALENKTLTWILMCISVYRRYQITPTFDTVHSIKQTKSPIVYVYSLHSTFKSILHTLFIKSLSQLSLWWPLLQKWKWKTKYKNKFVKSRKVYNFWKYKMHSENMLSISCNALPLFSCNLAFGVTISQ